MNYLKSYTIRATLSLFLIILSLTMDGCSGDASDEALSSTIPYTVTFKFSIGSQPTWLKETSELWSWESLSYEMPESVHIDYFCHEGNQEKRTGQRNLFGDNQSLTLYEGSFDLLAYNNDFDYITISYSDGDRTVIATTNENALHNLTEIPEGQKIRYQPDRLLASTLSLSLSAQTNGVTTNVSTGRAYALTTNCVLYPVTKLYLIRINLLNNDGRVTGCNEGLVTGLYSKMELYSHLGSGEAVSHIITFHKIKDEIVATLVCFGPNRNVNQELWLWLKYTNGYNLVKMDISKVLQSDDEQVTLNLDIEHEYPTPTGGGGTGNGGLDANVNEWEGEENHFIDL